MKKILVLLAGSLLVSTMAVAEGNANEACRQEAEDAGLSGEEKKEYIQSCLDWNRDEGQEQDSYEDESEEESQDTSED